MSKTTIEWTNRVWNFLTGCTKISAGCKFCYMFVLAERLKAMGQSKYRNGAKLTVHEHEIANPHHWKKPSLVFVNSMSDMFHEDVPLNILVEAFKVMNETPQHTYQILTKRPERLYEIQNEVTFTPNIWIGVSVEDDKVIHRVETLRMINAKVRWISAEPLIGPLTNLRLNGISWLVVGGESGNSKLLRPVKEEWITELRDKCFSTGIPFFFKQWGKTNFNPNQNDPTISKTHPQHAKGGCQLQGQVHREFPSINNSITNTNMKNQEKNEVIVNGKKLPKEAVDAIMPLLGLLLKNKSAVKPNNNLETRHKNVETLSPFKLMLAKALLDGEEPSLLATRMAKEREIPRQTAQAYITMVQKYLKATERLQLQKT